MISTMPKSGQAPSSPNAMPGGLGAILQQPGGAPKGMPAKNIQSMIDAARSMSDAQLADVLSGKSLDVPQYVAMTEAMGRKSLRTAMQGAQAQQQARQPSVKDKLLAEEAQAMQMAQAPQGGIDQLPAPNMGSVDMADGGIVAFSGADNDQQVEDKEYDPWAVSTPKLSGFDKRLWNAIKEKFGEWNQPWGKTVDATPAQIRGALTGKNVKEDMGVPHPSNVPAPTAEQTAAFVGDLNPPPTIGTSASRPSTLPATPSATGAPATKSGIAALNAAESGATPAREDYLAKLAGVGEKTRSGIAALKNEAQAQILLDAMSALTGNRNLAEAGAKFGQLAAGRVGAMGKERRSLEKEANDYELNLARYREAVESGDKDRALQAKKMMLEQQSRMAALSQGTDAMRNAMFISQHPELAHLFPSVAKSGQMSLTDAAKQWNDLPKENRQYYKKLQEMGISNEQDYYKFVNGQLLSATIPGQGANIRSY